MRLAIVGSTCLKGNWKALNLVEYLILLHELEVGVGNLTIVSGGAEGIDSMAELWAKTYGINFVGYYPEGKGWVHYNKRNRLIAENCDRLIRIVGTCTSTYGSGWTRDLAAKLGVPCAEFVI